MIVALDFSSGAVESYQVYRPLGEEAEADGKQREYKMKG